MDDVVVVLPGITGSVLRKDGKDVWAVSAGSVWNAIRTLGKSITSLQLDDDPPDVDDLGDGVVASAVMPDLSIVPGLWKIDGYGKLIESIKAAFAVEEGRNFFPFPYDWRRTNRVAARQLGSRSQEWLTRWRDDGHPDAKLVLIGHSMGGLVARYFLECLGGWRDTRLLLTFGTPYRGSLNAVGFIAHGMAKKAGPLTLVDLSKLIRSFTSVYELLPVYPCIDTGDGDLRRVVEVEGMPNLDPVRAASARQFHDEIRQAVERNRQDADYVERGYLVRPVVGMFQPTTQSASLSGGKVKLLRTYKGADQDGDGTVPRVSATPLELSNQSIEVYIADRHASLQNNDPVLVQVEGLLSGLALDLSAYYATKVRVGLEVDDLYAADEQVTVRAYPENPAVSLEAVLEQAGDGVVVQRAPLPDVPDGDGWRAATFGPLPAGSYRVRVMGGAQVDPVADVFLVAPAAEEG
jgi:hypothetical protein